MGRITIDESVKRHVQPRAGGLPTYRDYLKKKLQIANMRFPQFRVAKRLDDEFECVAKVLVELETK